MAAPEGVVLAVNGPYGSGKSSVINLVLHHLRPDIDAGLVRLVRFSPWWFEGADSLARAFFEALHAELPGALKGRAKKAAKRAIEALYRRTKPIRQIGAIGTDAATGLPAGTAAVAAAEAGVDYLGAARPIEEEYERLSDLLRDQQRRFLVIIDDIDRLDPGDAALVFRLVKSVGRLPNVIYLLAFDREIAESQVRERLGESAARYLEKIVQVGFDMPVLSSPLLSAALRSQLEGVVETPVDPRVQTRFENVVHDCVAPQLRTPRDVARLSNAVRVGWPAVAGDADAADFVALEAFKLARPAVYGAIRAHPGALCGLEPSFSGRESQGERAKLYDSALLATVPELEREGMRIALRRLFPRLDAVWGNLQCDAASKLEWRRERLVCSREHFDTYFLLAPGPGVIAERDVAEFLARVGDPDYIRARMLQAAALRTTAAGTQAGGLLDELALRAERIPETAIRPLLATLSSIADDIDVPEDDELPGWGNQLRLWRLVDELARSHLNQERRSALLAHCAEVAQVHWLCWLADLAEHDHKPPNGSAEGKPSEPLVSLEEAGRLRAAALEAIRTAARTGALLRHRRLRQLLFHWAEKAGDGGEQARRCINSLLDDADAVVRLAEGLTVMGGQRALGGNGFLGDRVDTRIPLVDRAALAQICDADRLATRAGELLRLGGLPEVQEQALRLFLSGLGRGAGGADPPSPDGDTENC